MKAVNYRNLLNTIQIIEKISSIRNWFVVYFLNNFNKGYQYCIAKNFVSFYSIGASLAIKQLNGGWLLNKKHFPYLILSGFKPSTKVASSNANFILYVKENVEQVLFNWQIGRTRDLFHSKVIID